MIVGINKYVKLWLLKIYLKNNLVSVFTSITSHTYRSIGMALSFINAQKSIQTAKHVKSSYRFLKKIVNYEISICLPACLSTGIDLVPKLLTNLSLNIGYFCCHKHFLFWSTLVICTITIHLHWHRKGVNSRNFIPFVRLLVNKLYRHILLALILHG